MSPEPSFSAEQILERVEDCMAITMNDAHPDSLRELAASKLYTYSIVGMLLQGEVDVPLATGYDEIEERNALHIDGTWYCTDQFGSLFALDDLDLLWYEIDVVDDDPDVTVYYMDIRDKCLNAII